MELNKIIKSLVIVLFVVFILGSSYILYTVQTKSKEEQAELIIPETQVLLPGYEISALIVEEDLVYVGGKDGVFILDINTQEVVENLTTELSLVYTASMIRSQRGDLWVGHDSGVSMYSNGAWIHFEAPDIPKGRCNKLLEADDIIYCGFQEGVALFSLNPSGEYEVVEQLSIEEGLAENNANAIYIDSNESIWYGAYYSDQIGGVSINSNNDWQYISIEDGLAHKYVTDIKGFDHDSKEYVIVGCGHLTSGGLTIFSVDTTGINLQETYNTNHGLPGEKVRSLYMSDLEDIWITTESDGLVITNPGDLLSKHISEGVYIRKENGLSDNEIKIMSENDKYYILGGKFGLTLIDKKVVEMIKVSNIVTKAN